jgi:hypothetical protein
MSDDTQVRSFLQRMANEIDLTPPDPHGPVKRARRHRSVMTAVVVVIVAAIVATGSVGVRSLTQTGPKPAQEPTQGPVPPGTRPVFQRTATIGGLTVTSPSDWFLVDYWGNWNPDATSLDTHAIPMLEVTNFDPGLSTPVCDTQPGRSTRLPADGVAIFVLIGNDGRTAADLCGGDVGTSSTGSAGLAPFTSVMTVGSNATDADRATANEIWRSMSWTGPLSFYGRGRSPRYILDGWKEGTGTGILEALPSEQNVELSFLEDDGSGQGGTDITVKGVPRPNALDGDAFGGVTQDAARVELRRAGVATPLVARLIDLPPSLHADYDAYVFEPQPTGGPFEVVAIGPDGSVLGSNLPPLVHTEKVGSVHAFGTTWTVKLSTAADGYYGSTCVEPAATSTLRPCERGWGGGLLVQTSDGPHPSVFVTESVGNIVTAVDVLADDGTVFHAVMIPDHRQGSLAGSVAVVALEGGGQGRLVYHMSGGRTDQGRRPEAQVKWPDLGQVIGNGSFPPPN